MPYHPSLKSLRIHQLLGERVVWTDELWDAALKYLLERVGTDDGIAMADTLNKITAIPVPYSPHKVDYLRLFRQFPPTLLLGIFDFIRAQG